MASSHHMKGALFAVLFVILQASLVKSEKQFQCKDHAITISDKQVEGMKKCGDAVGIKSIEEMTVDKIPCFSKCIMENGGLIDDKGKPHKENILRDIDAAVPGEVKEVYKKAMEVCIDGFGQHLAPGEASCASYAPMAMCATKAFKEICGM